MNAAMDIERGRANKLSRAAWLAGVVGLVALAMSASAATRGPGPAGPVAAEAAASAASSAGAKPRLSPYVVAARQHAQAASDTAHSAAVPPTMRRTHQAIGRRQQH